MCMDAEVSREIEAPGTTSAVTIGLFAWLSVLDGNGSSAKGYSTGALIILAMGLHGFIHVDPIGLLADSSNHYRGRRHWFKIRSSPMSLSLVGWVMRGKPRPEQAHRVQLSDLQHSGSFVHKNALPVIPVD